MSLAEVVGGRPRNDGDGKGLRILLTGRFDSDNWILSHVRPLSASSRCAWLWMVSTNPVPPVPKVTGVYPPKWLIKIVGATPARLVTFFWAAFRLRPHLVGGFHLLVNGLTATVAGRLIGARSMYFCVGGPVEVLDGGVWGEGNYFARMCTPDPVVEKRLLRAVNACDIVIAVGSRAVKFFREKGVRTRFHVVSGGIDQKKFLLADQARSIDAIMTGRLVPIKRIDVFLDAVKRVAETLPNFRAAIVGDGPLRQALARQAENLGISRCVTFTGYQEDVGEWLNRAKLFVLTSDSEGLSLSMMEAMTCGLPAVVSNVGDLADLVTEGSNGYLVPRRDPQAFADRIIELLTDDQKLAEFSQAARQSALRYGPQQTIQQWNAILA